MIVIIDYGMGNLRSVKKAFDKIKIEVVISGDYREILKADKIVLPGVGNFKKGMQNLIEKNIYDAINEVVIIKKKEVLGICLGMQLMTESSEEGNCEGLAWIKGRTVRLSLENRELKIPHMGWNNIQIKKSENILKSLPSNALFYFVHSYHVKCENPEDIGSFTQYGISFVSSIETGNIFGCQFHPEKSYEAGIQILKNFAGL